MMPFLELIGNFIELIVDVQFWRDKKKRRKFEKENNLPKKTMVNPNHLALFYFTVLAVILIVLFFLYKHHYYNVNSTTKQITEIKKLLNDNNSVDGYYPEKLEGIIRNNPLRKNITTDSWGNEYFYKPSKDQQSFILISKGKDGILNTNDDIKAH